MLFDERRLKALYHIQGYQRRIARAFNKKVKSRNLKKGDLVLKDNRAPIHDPRGKFRPNWTGPYIIKAIWSGGAVVLMDLDGLEFSQPINMDTDDFKTLKPFGMNLLHFYPLRGSLGRKPGRVTQAKVRAREKYKKQKNTKMK